MKYQLNKNAIVISLSTRNVKQTKKSRVRRKRKHQVRTYYSIKKHQVMNVFLALELRTNIFEKNLFEMPSIFRGKSKVH